jgi:hypothetical protein
MAREGAGDGADLISEMIDWLERDHDERLAKPLRELLVLAQQALDQSRRRAALEQIYRTKLVVGSWPEARLPGK